MIGYAYYISMPNIQIDMDIYKACSQGNIDVIKYYLDNTLDFKINKAYDIAVKNNQINVIKYLMEIYDDLIKNIHTIIITCRYGNVEILKFLVNSGANIHVDNDWGLCVAVQYGHIDIVKYLLEFNANINCWNGLPISRAAKKGNLEIVKLLVEYNADIHVKNDNAIQQAALMGHLNIIKYLVEQQGNIHGDDDRALYWAHQNNHTDIVKYLLQYNADQNSCNHRLLNDAIYSRDIAEIKRLVNDIDDAIVNDELMNEAYAILNEQ